MTLRRLIPRSLFGRNMLLIIGLICVAELAVALAFHQWVQKPRLQRTVAFTLTYIRSVESATRSMDPATRLRYAQTLSHSGAVRLLQTETPTTFAPAENILIRALLTRLGEQLGADHRLDWEPGNEPRVWIRMDIDGQPWWLGVNARGYDGTPGQLLLAMMVAVGLLALLGAAIIQRHLHQPLIRLAHAADQVALGETPILDLAGAPIELQRLAERFQHMANTLAATEREREIMLAGISHDLRTPLAKLRLATELLAGEDNTDLRMSMIRNIAAADEVIDQFIDFARLGLEEQPSACEAGELVNSIATLTHAPRLSVAMYGDLPILYCRPVALRRALVNLIENALRYSTGVVRFDVRHENGEFTFIIADAGPGIEAEAMTRLRQPFTRLDQSRNGPPGAGLGLAIVDRVARLHHGQLHLRNRPDGGLEARLSLPGTPA